MESGEFVRTLIVAVVTWVGLIVVTEGNSIAVMGGWLVGIVVATMLPFIGRWLTGGPWRDPKELGIAAEREQRRVNMIEKGKFSTDAELIARARNLAAAAGREFPGSKMSDKDA